MKFLSIKIKNFMSIGKLELELADRGIILVTGRNRDNPSSNSNGSGKSSIWDALIWALYGRVLRDDVGADDVVRLNGKGCSVRLRLEDDRGRVWTLRRTRGIKSSPSLDLMCDGRNVSGAISGTTQEKVIALVGCDYPTFASSIVFGQDTLRFAQLTDKEKKGVLERLLGLEVYEKAYKLVCHKISAQKMAIELSKASWLHMTEAIKEKRKKWIELSEKAAKEKADIKTIINGYKKKIRQLKREGREIKKYLDDAEAREQENSRFREKLKYAQDEAARCKELAQEYEEEAADLRETLHGVRSDKGTPCPTCGKGLDKGSRRHACDVIERGLRRNAKRLQRAESRYLRFKTRIRKYAGLLEKHSAPKNLPELRSTYGRNRERIVSIRAALSYARGTRIGSGQAILDLGAEIKSLQRRVDQENDSIQKQKHLLEKRKYWQQAFSATGIRSYLLDGIVPFLNKRANYYSQIMTAGHVEIKFTTVTKLRSGSYAEKFSILVSNVKKQGANIYGGSSAGERHRVDLCVALALKDLARSRNKNRLDLVVFDEAFESLDEAGSERVIQLLNSENENFGSCFVISHSESLKQFFTEKIEVVKRNGVSRLEGEGD